MLRTRGQYAAFVTVLAGMVVLVLASTMVLQFESRSAGANITDGGDALWWSVVTITTVGYGDRFPVTGLGRITAALVMFAGVGIVGALASILASVLVPQPEGAADDDLAIREELTAVRQELEALRRAVELGSDRAP